MNRYSTAIYAAVCVWLIAGAVPRVQAQTALEQLKAYKAEQEKLDQEVQSRFEEMAVATDADIKAGKIAPEVASRAKEHIEDMRNRLKGLTSFENRSTDASPELSKARENFSAAVKARGTQRTEKLNGIRDAVVQSLLSTWRKAERAEDLKEARELLQEVDRVASEIERFSSGSGSPLRGNFRWHMDNSSPGVRSASLSNIVQEFTNLLGASERFLKAFADKDFRLIGAALNEMQPGGAPQSAKIVSPADIDQWRMRFREKAAADAASLQAQVDGLIAKAVTTKELLPVMEKLRTAIDCRWALEGNLRGGNAVEPVKESLGSWLRVLAIAESGDWRTLQREGKFVGLAPDWLSPAAQQGFYAKLKEVDEVRTAGGKAERAQMEKQIREKLAKVTDAASALAVADELPIEPNNTGDSTRERLVALQSDLKRLAASWNAQSSAALLSEMFREGGTPHPWQADLRALRSKILRENIAQTSNSPELLAAPLDALPLETAVRKLGATLKEKQDWKRLHDLLATARPGYDRGDWGQNDELRGVKAFLTGQNFEKAEQYGDAVQSYRAVMGCIGELVPVDAAAERLKTIAREHPEAVKPVVRPGTSADLRK